MTRAPAAEVVHARECLTKEDLLLRKAAGVSFNYRGDPTVASNQSAVIPDSENTSLFVTGLPRESATYYDLMDLLKGRGKIFAASIAEQNSAFPTAAATITFFRHIDAKNVLKAINDGTLHIRAGSEDSAITVDDHDGNRSFPEWRCGSPNAPGCKEGILITLADEDDTSFSTFRPKSKGRLQACWNRVRVAEGPQHRQHSRVIYVRGSAAAVNPGSLQSFFSSKFRYCMERIIYHGIHSDDSVEYEYRFSCWKNQVSSNPKYQSLCDIPIGTDT
jgi:RNA recognition motif-containing protein